MPKTTADYNRIMDIGGEKRVFTAIVGRSNGQTFNYSAANVSGGQAQKVVHDTRKQPPLQKYTPPPPPKAHKVSEGWRCCSSCEKRKQRLAVRMAIKRAIGLTRSI